MYVCMYDNEEFAAHWKRMHDGLMQFRLMDNVRKHKLKHKNNDQSCPIYKSLILEINSNESIWYVRFIYAYLYGTIFLSIIRKELYFLSDKLSEL